MSQDDSLPASWSEDVLVRSSPNFQHTPRISAINPPEVVIAKILEHEESGIPLIVEDWDKRPDWDYARFSIEGFLEGPPQLLSVRDVRTTKDIQMRLDDLISHYQNSLRKNLLQENTLYGKDLPCPTSWEQWIRNVLPEHCHPLGSNDMFSHLSAQELPESLMCYIGIGETFTPAHKDPCGSFGHNIMCYASENGSAFWFMSETGNLDEDIPSMYFREKLHTDLDLESRKVTVQEFREAPFTVYCAKQRLGDLVLVPPRSCHQVVNAGGITVKMSWSRMGIKSLEYALHSELLLYHRICRPETYRVKLTVFRVLRAYAQRLGETTVDEDLPSKLLKIINLFDEILVEEWSPDHQTLPMFENDDTDMTFISSCDFCGADIFQSFFACTRCSSPDGTNIYICCPSCYVEGRSCLCGAEYMKPYQTVPFSSLIEERNEATTALRQYCSEPIALEWTPTVKGSSHVSIFRAACLYRAHVLGSIIKYDYLRCSVDRTPGHSCPAPVVLRCSPCHRGVCFQHNLECRDIHSAEGMLIYELGHFEWHERHMFRPDKQVRPTPQSVDLYCGEHSKRLARAALNSRRCRPLDSRRSLPGFYDKWVLIGTHAGNDQSSKECISYLQSDDDSSASSPPPASSRSSGSDSDTGDSYLTPLGSSGNHSPLRLHLRSRPSRLSYSDLTITAPSSPWDIKPSPPNRSHGSTLCPNLKKRPYVEIAHLPIVSKVRDPTPFKRPRLEMLDAPCDTTDVTSVSTADIIILTSAFVTDSANAFKGRTVVPIPSRPVTAASSPQACNTPRELSVALSPTGVTQREEVPITPIQVKRRRKGAGRRPRKLDANISSSHVIGRIGPPKGAKRLQRVESSVVTSNHISSGKKNLPSSPAVPRAPTTPLNKPVPPTASTAPTLTSSSNITAISKPKTNAAILEFQEILKFLHPGDTLSQRKMMEGFQAADEPEVLVCRLFRKFVDDHKRTQQELDRLRAEGMAVKFQMSYAKDVPSVSEYKALQDECRQWKNRCFAGERKAEQLQASLDVHNRISRNPPSPPKPPRAPRAVDVPPWSDSSNWPVWHNKHNTHDNGSQCERQPLDQSLESSSGCHNKSHPSTVDSGYEGVHPLKAQDVGLKDPKDAWGSQDPRRDNHPSSYAMNHPSTTETRYESHRSPSKEQRLNLKDTWGSQDGKSGSHQSCYATDRPLTTETHNESFRPSSKEQDLNSKDIWGSQDPERNYHQSRYVPDRPLVKESQQSSSKGQDKYSRDMWGSQDPKWDNDQTWLQYRSGDRVEQTAFREHGRSADVDRPFGNRFRETQGHRNNRYKAPSPSYNKYPPSSHNYRSHNSYDHRNYGTSRNTPYRDNRRGGGPGPGERRNDYHRSFSNHPNYRRQ